ncbi:MAG: FtsW/RodA/SpoVE family cell cycle protein [Clostridia bacterium]|nr:FtsW/RodA/SpoVE family cell cycle protein [Clostridia bacterium]
MGLRHKDPVRKAGRRLTDVVMLFFLSGFLLLAIRRNDVTGYVLAAGVPLIIWLGSTLLPMIFHVDSLMLALTNFLCALGVLLLYDTNPEYARQQVVWYGFGMFAMLVCIWGVRTFHFTRRSAWILAAVSLVLLVLPVLFGRETYGAKNWVYIAGISFQPSEAVKLCLLIVLARWMADRHFWPWFLFAMACLALLMLQMDLGTALLYYGVTLMLGFASTGSFFLLLAGIVGAGGAAWIGYHLFAHVKKRLAIWLNPWAVYDTFGYQIVQGLIALASGGLMGVGLGLGSPTTIPVYESDFIFAVLCEQFGLVFALCVLAIVVALIWRGATIAMAARTSFHGLLAMGATLMIGLQTFVIIGGVIKLIPLTGVTMPFVSYGGTSLLSSMCLVGLIQGVESLNRDDLAEDTRLALQAEEADV